jgi:hypothetical protein
MRTNEELLERKIAAPISKTEINGRREPASQTTRHPFIHWSRQSLPPLHVHVAVYSKHFLHLDVITGVMLGGAQIMTFLTLQFSSSPRFHVDRYHNGESHWLLSPGVSITWDKLPCYWHVVPATRCWHEWKAIVTCDTYARLENTGQSVWLQCCKRVSEAVVCFGTSVLVPEVTAYLLYRPHTWQGKFGRIGPQKRKAVSTLYSVLENLPPWLLMFEDTVFWRAFGAVSIKGVFMDSVPCKRGLPRDSPVRILVPHPALPYTWSAVNREAWFWLYLSLANSEFIVAVLFWAYDRI